MTAGGPRISIITITMNSARYLEDTIRSVAEQDYPDIEYVVVDGGSSDATLEIIARNKTVIDRSISEPDQGIADAMNKGLALATGDYVYFLHSDDYLEGPGVISRAAGFLEAERDIVLFSIHLDKDGIKTLRRPRGFGPWMNFKTGVYHQSAICSARLLERIGAFDTDFRITMDYDFFLRAYRDGVRPKIVDLPLATMRLVGVSSQDDWAALRRRFAEERRTHANNCRSVALRVVYALYWPLYLAYRRVSQPLRR